MDHDKPFLSQTATLRALGRLITGKSLTIYCGAGVTIGHTGLGWKAMVAELAKEESSGRQTKNKRRRSDAIDEIFRNAGVSPEHFASMIVEYVKAEKRFDDLEMEAFIANKLANALYKKHRWNKGTIVGNITRLAVYMTMAGIPVRILTTNYDTHIENSFEEFISFLQETTEEEGESQFEPAWPGLKWRTVGDTPQSEELHSARNVTESIEVIYLHGRVAEDGRTQGHVVLTEGDYALTADSVLSELREQLSRPEDRLLVVGSSMTDSPLVRALALSKEVDNYRCAVMLHPRDLAHDDVVTRRRISQILDRRGSHLGVDILHPQTYGQVSQFCEEASICFFHDRLLGNPGSYARKGTGVRYGQRLAHWWPEWSRTHSKADYARDYRIMREGLDTSRSFLPHAKLPESFRLELWVRRDKDLSTRSITLWASSMGPIVERGFLRTESVVADSTNASVRALRAGKPVLLSLEDLGLTAAASRWQSFLSVPILVQVHPSGKLGGDVPVGVVTLATSCEKEKSALTQCSPSELQDLIVFLIAKGRRILSVQ